MPRGCRFAIRIQPVRSAVAAKSVAARCSISACSMSSGSSSPLVLQGKQDRGIFRGRGFLHGQQRNEEFRCGIPGRVPGRPVDAGGVRDASQRPGGHRLVEGGRHDGFVLVGRGVVGSHEPEWLFSRPLARTNVSQQGIPRHLTGRRHLAVPAAGSSCHRRRVGVAHRVGPGRGRSF